jgi:small-conductance mechanosensitive channel
MSALQKIAAGLLLALLAVVGYGLWATPSTPRTAHRLAAQTGSAEAPGEVDETDLTTAKALAEQATSAEERAAAQAVVQAADHEVDVAFAAALRRIEAHPPVLSPEAQKIDARLTALQKQLEADKASVARLTAQLAQVPESQRGGLQDQLNLAQSQLELDQDEVEDENQNLVAAGGNAHQRIEAMLKQHAAVDDKPPALPAGKDVLAGLRGLARRLRHYLELRARLDAVVDARERVVASLPALGSDRQSLATQLAAGKSGVADHADAAGLLNATRRIAADQKVLTLLDQRISIRKDIVALYGKWQDVLRTRMTRTLHASLLDLLVVIGILLVLLFLDRWLESLFRRTKLDRRQIATLRTVTRVALQIVGIVAIALVLVGVPGQMGTFLGIVGAGLTVALKDFIVGFIGWVVLMGKNGMRLGDWVEINGVSGEVVDLGMFHTVLLETGNWTEAGHPTGRRVTFANSFAIQGHYFNFSTSGQWLWDEVLVLVPYERDPHAVADAILKEVLAITGDTSREAEREWQRAARTQREITFSAAPGIIIRPAAGGVEVAVRYVTRASERFKLRTRLYQTAVHMLSSRSMTSSTAPERLQMTTQT